MVLAAGKMYRPSDVAFGGNGIVFVVEQFNHRISKWTYTQPSYTFTLDTTWGDKNPTDGTTGTGGPIVAGAGGGPSDGNFYRPTGIAFDSTNSRLYVTDTFHDRVRVINSSTGAFVSSFGTGGFGTANFYRPAGIAINTSTGTTLVIADELNLRAVKYDVNAGAPNNPVVLPDPSATMVLTDLSFVRPHGATYDIDTATFNIGDSLRSRISSYNVAGAFQSQFGTPGVTGRVPATPTLFYPASGEGTLNGTTTFTVFADTRNNNLKSMDNAVITATTGTIAGTGDGQLYYPESVSTFTDTVNYVLAANTLNNRVETFSNTVFALTAQTPFNFGKP